MKTKKAMIIVVIIFTQFCIAFGQYVNNYQGTYPLLNWTNNTLNNTLARGIDNKSYVLATTPGIVIDVPAITLLNLDDNLFLNYTKSYQLPARSNILDAISATDKAYVICGNMEHNNSSIAFIAKFDEDLKFIWGQVYPTISSLNSITEIITADNIEEKYIAVGTTYSTINTSRTGVILCTDMLGRPLWENNTTPTGTVSRFDYNQVVPIYDNNQTFPDFAAVGSTYIQTGSKIEKDILVTRIKVDGNNLYSKIIGNRNTYHPNDQYIHDEEGFGICSYKDQLIITSRFNYIHNQIPINDLVFIISLNATNGTEIWNNIYNLPYNSCNGTYAQSIIEFKDDLYINGYYEGTLFNSSGSEDAFLLQLTEKGDVKNLKVFGEDQDDRILKLMINNNEDGIINAGYTNSFNGGSYTNAPYIIESYQTTQDNCHMLLLETHANECKFTIEKEGNTQGETQYYAFEMFEIQIPVDHVIVCDKVPFVYKNPMSIDNKIADDLSVYPTITSNSLNINGIIGETTYYIYSQTGSLCQSGNIKETTCIDISKLSKGMYYISILNNNKMSNLKFVKE